MEMQTGTTYGPLTCELKQAYGNIGLLVKMYKLGPYFPLSMILLLIPDNI